MIPRRLLLVTLLLALLAQLGPAQKRTSISSEVSAGLTIVTIPTPWGEIKILLPYDIRAGDTISGTVMTEPAGKTDKERQRDADELNGCVIEVEKQKSTVSTGLIHIAVPSAATQSQLIVLDARGKQVGKATVPVAPGKNPPMTPMNFVIPQLGQSGSLLPLPGTFDGDATDTKVNIDGEKASVLAESPRVTVIEIPDVVVGPHHVTVADNGKTATGDFRALKIDLTAPKTSLMKGESTELHVQVQGLQGITQPVPIQIQNQTPQNVNITGGNTQNVVIQPSQVSTGGTFNWTTPITGTGAGGFNIRGTIPATTTPPRAMSQPSPSAMPVPSPQSSPAAAQANQTQSTATASPSPPPAVTPMSKTEASPAPDEPNLYASFADADSDCCKRLITNGVLTFQDDKGNSFTIDHDKLKMVVDGHPYEWQFTQDGKPMWIEWMFCHLRDHQIVSQLDSVQAQQIKGGRSSESAHTTSVSMAGPYRDEKSNVPFYGFQFFSQKTGSNEKEYAISFSMDPESCKWSFRLLAEGRTVEFRQP